MTKVIGNRTMANAVGAKIYVSVRLMCGDALKNASTGEHNSNRHDRTIAMSNGLICGFCSIAILSVRDDLIIGDCDTGVE